jgi:hypothetical protein
VVEFLFDLLDLRSHHVVISPHYVEATDVGTPTGQSGMAEAERKADREVLNEMNAKMDANQAKATKQEEMMAEISARMTINLKQKEADRKRDREDLKGMMEEINAKMDGNQVEMR